MAFIVGVEDVNKVVDLCRNLMIKQKKQFAVLIPISVVGEIARQENVDGERFYDEEIISSVESLSRIVLAHYLHFNSQLTGRRDVVNINQWAAY
jgi:hypothetical protein